MPVSAQDLAAPALAASRPSTAASRSPGAAPTEGKPTVAKLQSWNSLSAAQRLALAPLEKDWGRLDQQRRLKWLEIAARFPSLPADEQARMQERMRSWAELSPTERGQARLMFQQAKQIAPESRQAKWEAYQALEPEQRQELADKAAKRTSASNTANGTSQAKTARNLAPERKAALADRVKSNLVPDRNSAPVLKSVTPTLVQNKPGASTTLINQAAARPAHQQGGLTKIVAAPDLVDSNTLLPKRGAASATQDESRASKPRRP